MVMMHPTEPGDPRYTETQPRYYNETEPAPVQPGTRVRRVEGDEAYAPSWRGWRASQIVYTIGGIVELLILIRAVLELLAANPDAGFTSLNYTITDPLV